MKLKPVASRICEPAVVLRNRDAASLILSAVLVALASGWMPLSVHAATKTWDSLGGPWSNPNNWDPAGVPQNGDDLKFGGNIYREIVNDLTNLTVRSLDFMSGSWQLSGNTLGVSGSIGNGGDGSVEIQCGIRLEGAATFIALSTLPSDTSELHVTGPIDLNGRALRLVCRSEATLDLSGPISGNGSINIGVETVNYFPAGTVKFSGTEANTFTGPVTLTSQDPPLFLGVVGAKLLLDKESTIAVPGALVIGTNSEVKVARSHQIANNAAVSLGPGGALLLEGNTETIGSLNFTSGWSSSYYISETLVDTGGATLSVEGNITSDHRYTNNMPTIRGKLGLPPGNHIITTRGNQFYGLNIEAQILGDGGFTKSGPTALALQGNNIFNGDVTVAQGSVVARHPNALGSAAGVTSLTNSGSLSLDNVAIDNESLLVRGGYGFSPETPGSALFAFGTNIWSGPVILETNLVVSGEAVDLNGSISGPGGLHCLSGTVELGGTEANTFTGTTLVRNRLLLLNKPTGVPAFGGPFVVGGGNEPLCEARWLQDYQRLYANVTLFNNALVNLNNHRDDFGPITFNGGMISTGTGELGVYGLVKVNFEESGSIDGRLGLPPGYHEFLVEFNPTTSAGLHIYANIVGSGHLRKTGLGRLWLGGASTYTGLTVVDQGTLIVTSAGALGASSTGTTVNDGGTLQFSPGLVTILVPEPISIRGTGAAGDGALEVLGNTTLRNPLPSIYACLDLTTNATIRVESGGVLTVDGFVSGIGPLTKAGPGTLVLANINPNTYSGDTFVTEGVLNLAKPNFAISVPGNLIVGPAPLNSSAIARWSTSGGMNPGAIATINARCLLDLNGNAQPLSRLNLNDGGDAQTGAGLLSFPVGGMVAVGSLSQLGSHASCSVSGNLGLPANGTLVFAVGAYAPSAPFDFNPELDVSASMAAPAENPSFERAGILKNGPGTMRLSGGNSFNGRADVAEGTLIAANSLALGSSFDGTFVLNNARLALEGGLNVENEILVMNSTASPALEMLFAESYWSGQMIMQRHTSVGARVSSLLQLAGVISGAANLTKLGPGTLRFGGGNHNTYSGETFVNEGILLMSKPLAVTSIPGSLNIGTSAGLSAMAANLTSYQVVGNIFVNRGGLLNLNGQVENVDHLWLTEGGDVQTTTGVLFLKTGGSIQVVPGAVGDLSTISGNLDMDPGAHVLNVGPGTSVGPQLEIAALMTSSLGGVSLQKNGAGTLRLTGNNSYSGSTTINAGALQVDGSQPSSSVVVQGGARLSGNGRSGLVTFTSPSGIVAPGASPGNLQVGHFNLDAVGGVLQIELNGTTVGSGYDRLTVRGLVDLTGMTLQVSLNFAPAIGDQFVIVGNDLFDQITGEFNGLPQDAIMTLGDHIFQINYSGGDGNDVVLTKTAEVYRPVLTIQRAAPGSVRLLWPTNDPSFILQSTTNLSSPNWIAALPLPIVIGTNNVVTNAITGARKFYRLVSP